ncbi:MAG: type II secretion system protein [Acidobacteria bacterium]|nr:type II secretion system protein [Acidobacteriota bacterium]
MASADARAARGHGDAAARGVALPEVLAAVALVGLVTAVTIPVVADRWQEAQARNSARYLAHRLLVTQSEAMRRSQFVALQFTGEDDDPIVRPFVDGNGNGVLSADIAAGVDVPLAPAEHLGWRGRDVGLRVNQRVRDIGSDTWLEPGSDPRRIGRSPLVSFGPTGTVTAGTLYVGADRGPQFAVRMMPATGRVRLLQYDRGSRAWQP